MLKTTLWIIVLVLVVVPCSFSSDRKDPKTDCVSYHSQRATDFLGCCGDIGFNYLEPNSSEPLNEGTKATLALREITRAKACRQYRSSANLALALNEAGAHIVRGRYLSSVSDSESGKRQAERDFDSAAAILQKFTKDHPRELSKIWWWIADALVAAHRPWLAMDFIVRLPDGCCRTEQLARYKGDIFFKQGALNLAANNYSEHLKAARWVCENDELINRVKFLREKRFEVPEITTEAQLRESELQNQLQALNSGADLKPIQQPGISTQHCALMERWLPYVAPSVFQ